MADDLLEDSLQFTRPPSVAGVELLHGIFCGPNLRSSLVFAYAVNLVEDGDAEILVGGESHRYAPGTVILTEPGFLVAVTRRHSPQSDQRLLYVDPALFQARMEELTEGQATDVAFRSAVTTDRELRDGLLDYYAALERNASAADQASRLDAVFGTIARGHLLAPGVARKTWPSRPAIRRVKDYIESHYADDIDLDCLVGVSGISKFHLIRLFRSEIGVPPHSYQTHVRVARARVLLQQGVSSSHAATEVGFADQSHLIRNFKRIIGVTPGRYARSIFVTAR